MDIASFYIGLSLLSSYVPKAGHAILREESRRILMQLNGKAFVESDILTGENGRPYFPGGAQDFNISHSANISAVSYVKGENLSTGCDIQLVKPRANTLKIADTYFSPAEKKYILSNTKDTGSTKKFFYIWALKECYIKLRGLSVFDITQTPSFISESNFENFYFSQDTPSSFPLSFFLYELAGPDEQYILAAAIEGKIHRPEIKWFSQSSLQVRSITEISSVHCS